MDFIRLLWVMLVVTALALCVVREGQVNRRAGRRLENLECQIETLTAQGHKLRAEISRLKSPDRISGGAKRLGLEQATATPPFTALPPGGPAGR
jgi:cell division protein FtsL